MSNPEVNYFDQAAATWEAKPQRIELAAAIGAAIIEQVRPTRDMDVLDYGCGTGLLSVYLLPHVRSVVGADSSPGMLRVMDEKIQAGGLQQIRTARLELESEPSPSDRFHLIVASMVMHHVNKTDSLLAAFYEMLLPGGVVALADLDTEPGTFHGSEIAESIYHHGFDRRDFRDRLGRAGFVETKDVTAQVIRKPIENGELHDFPVFLIVGKRG